MKYILIACILYSGLTGAQSHSELALAAYLQNDLERWDEAIAATSTIADDEERTVTSGIYHLTATYAAMAAENEASLDRHMDALDEIIDEVWDITETNGVAHGLYSAYLGLKIARKPMTGMLYGSRAASYAEDAVDLAPDDPRALYYAASNLFYTPKTWGGDQEKAEAYLLKASRQYGDDAKNDFHYLETLALLGQAQAALGKTDAARATYERALQLQPEFGYVKNRLLPSLENAEK